MDRIKKLINLFLLLFWGYCAAHFGYHQLLDYPRWEHYICEGYFLFSTFVFTLLWLSLSREKGD